MTNDKKVYRATFEVVIEKQEMLRQMLDELIKEGRPIKNDEERKKYLLLLARSTLGVGTDDSIDSTILMSTEGKIKNIERTARWLAYQEDEIVEMPRWCEPPALVGQEYKIQEVWKMLRNALFSTFPKAINLAVQASPERIPQTKRKPDEV